MSSLSSMELAVALARRQRDKASQDWVSAREALQFAQSQAQQLQSYAKDTESRWISQSSRMSSPALMHHYQQFMEKLHQALDMQREVLVLAQQRVDTRQQLLTQAEFTLASRESVLTQMQAAQRRRAEQINQKAQDELAAAQYRRSQQWAERGGES